MTADDDPTNATQTEEQASPDTTTEAPSAPEAEEAPAETAAKPEPTAEEADKPAPAADAEPEEAPAPVFDPESCKAIAIGMDAFENAALDGEFADTDFQYYLEPAGVLNARLVCTRSPEDDPQRGGILMTRAGWQAKKVCFDDGVNPETYELSFPKEFGYVKPLSHYEPETRKSAKYPWSKKY